MTQAASTAPVAPPHACAPGVREPAYPSALARGVEREPLVLAEHATRVDAHHRAPWLCTVHARLQMEANGGKAGKQGRLQTPKDLTVSPEGRGRGQIVMNRNKAFVATCCLQTPFFPRQTIGTARFKSALLRPGSKFLELAC
eukprot:6213414-Pleurochrysis_carterae.AAC.4